MSSAAGAGPAKAAAKIALLGLDAASCSVLTECFRQFGIEAVSVDADETYHAGGAYPACVVPLTREAEPVLKAIRKQSHRTVVYGTCGSVNEALRFAEYGINAVFQTPVAKQEVLQVVRATHLLVLKELRRYIRVPLVCSVRLETGTEILEGNSLEVSAGGMSLVVKGHVGVPQAVLARFALPGHDMVAVKSVVCWTRRDEGTAAIRFDPTDPRRTAIRDWVDQYLDV